MPHPTRTPLLVAVLALVGVGCGGDDASGGSCVSSTECAGDQRCVDGTCERIPPGIDAGPDPTLIDAGRSDADADAGPGDDAATCEPTDETCNGADDDCDGMIDEALVGCATCTGDACADPRHPGPCRVEGDQGLDGTVDRVWTYVYEMGLLVQRDYDRDNDGIRDTRIAFENEASTGRRISDTRYDGAGMVTGRAIYVYEGGRRVRVEYDLNDDGATDQITHDVWSARLLSRQDVDIGADGSIDQRWFYLYDDDGVRTRAERERMGVIDRTITYAYDTDGNTLYTEHDNDVDGTPDERRTHDYSCWAAP